MATEQSQNLDLKLNLSNTLEHSDACPTYRPVVRWSEPRLLAEGLWVSSLWDEKMFCTCKSRTWLCCPGLCVVEQSWAEWLQPSGVTGWLSDSDQYRCACAETSSREGSHWGWINDGGTNAEINPVTHGSDHRTVDGEGLNRADCPDELNSKGNIKHMIYSTLYIYIVYPVPSLTRWFWIFLRRPLLTSRMRRLCGHRAWNLQA